VDYEDMIFFDDEERNIRDVGGLGVLAVYAPHGVSHALVRDAFAKFKRSK
jgi:magnesium-dependent phosphatase 1